MFASFLSQIKKKHVSFFGEEFSPLTMMADGAFSIQNAVIADLPKTDLLSCLFNVLKNLRDRSGD